jgi:hypothetical protein
MPEGTSFNINDIQETHFVFPGSSCVQAVQGRLPAGQYMPMVQVRNPHFIVIYAVGRSRDVWRGDMAHLVR